MSGLLGIDKKMDHDGPMPLPETARLHLLMHVENGPATAYFLSKNPEFVAKLNWLEAQGAGVRVIEEINKISHGIAFRGSAHQQRQASAAQHEKSSGPQPLRHIGGRGPANTAGGYSDSMSQRDYNAWRDGGGRR
jgi:hypothetical protein